MFKSITKMFGSSDEKVIKKVITDMYTSTNTTSAPREVRYTIQPNPLTADADDDFGFNETTSFFQDAQGYNPETGEDDNK